MTAPYPRPVTRHLDGSVACDDCGARLGDVIRAGRDRWTAAGLPWCRLGDALEHLHDAHDCPGRRRPLDVAPLLPATAPQLAERTGYSVRRVRQVLASLGLPRDRGAGRAVVWRLP